MLLKECSSPHTWATLRRSWFTSSVSTRFALSNDALLVKACESSRPEMDSKTDHQNYNKPLFVHNCCNAIPFSSVKSKTLLRNVELSASSCCTRLSAAPNSDFSRASLCVRSLPSTCSTRLCWSHGKSGEIIKSYETQIKIYVPSPPVAWSRLPCREFCFLGDWTPCPQIS